jgi:hypothetical protein
LRRRREIAPQQLRVGRAWLDQNENRDCWRYEMEREGAVKARREQQFVQLRYSGCSVRELFVPRRPPRNPHSPTDATNGGQAA